MMAASGSAAMICNTDEQCMSQYSKASPLIGMKPIRLRSDNASEYRRRESGEQGFEIRTVLSWLAGEKDEVWVTSSYGRSG